jgi:hypothetical protein
MKKIYLVLFSLLFSGSALLASPTSKGGLSVDESQFLFGTQKANVELISQSEMSKTEAQGWFSAIVVVASFTAAVAYNPSLLKYTTNAVGWAITAGVSKDLP